MDGAATTQEHDQTHLKVVHVALCPHHHLTGRDGLATGTACSTVPKQPADRNPEHSCQTTGEHFWHRIINNSTVELGGTLKMKHCLSAFMLYGRVYIGE